MSMRRIQNIYISQKSHLQYTYFGGGEGATCEIGCATFFSRLVPYDPEEEVLYKAYIPPVSNVLMVPKNTLYISVDGAL